MTLQTCCICCFTEPALDVAAMLAMNTRKELIELNAKMLNQQNDSSRSSLFAPTKDLSSIQVTEDEMTILCAGSGAPSKTQQQQEEDDQQVRQEPDVQQSAMTSPSQNETNHSAAAVLEQRQTTAKAILDRLAANSIQIGAWRWSSVCCRDMCVRCVIYNSTNTDQWGLPRLTCPCCEGAIPLRILFEWQDAMIRNFQVRLQLAQAECLEATTPENADKVATFQRHLASAQGRAEQLLAATVRGIVYMMRTTNQSAKQISTKFPMILSKYILRAVQPLLTRALRRDSHENDEDEENEEAEASSSQARPLKPRAKRWQPPQSILDCIAKMTRDLHSEDSMKSLVDDGFVTCAHCCDPIPLFSTTSMQQTQAESTTAQAHPKDSDIETPEVRDVIAAVAMNVDPDLDACVSALAAHRLECRKLETDIAVFQDALKAAQEADPAFVARVAATEATSTRRRGGKFFGVRRNDFAVDHQRKHAERIEQARLDLKAATNALEVEKARFALALKESHNACAAEGAVISNLEFVSLLHKHDLLRDESHPFGQSVYYHDFKHLGRDFGYDGDADAIEFFRLSQQQYSRTFAEDTWIQCPSCYLDTCRTCFREAHPDETCEQRMKRDIANHAVGEWNTFAYKNADFYFAPGSDAHRALLVLDDDDDDDEASKPLLVEKAETAPKAAAATVTIVTPTTTLLSPMARVLSQLWQLSAGPLGAVYSWLDGTWLRQALSRLIPRLGAAAQRPLVPPTLQETQNALPAGRTRDTRNRGADKLWDRSDFQVAQLETNLAAHLVVRNTTLPCMMCRRPITRDGGCPHMTCSFCTADWCWDCASVDSWLKQGVWPTEFATSPVSEGLQLVMQKLFKRAKTCDQNKSSADYTLAHGLELLGESSAGTSNDAAGAPAARDKVPAYHFEEDDNDAQYTVVSDFDDPYYEMALAWPNAEAIRIPLSRSQLTYLRQCMFYYRTGDCCKEHHITFSATLPHLN
ncbi:hypothetical protein CAOG_00042 [Capsaspora owczarzaki ATCC 30864]|uniref:RING-type domain-containing protein n=1 Tax=Capsaspora owczarzaki (strain ATCC 30864) TaxID=595528 RepID=A0A0D2WG85_CAPO3|nr:hypothetical protein CAOG_00042 [Capsaspora owczarzaki ATCC 30864]KJE88380.1 hypothetical protein CAOG_000042 [Capsaspora owczarzaki ATCC 30864]|eukprot:XP_004364913.1 hypothetical protein CAOG_00042 [Capsaspora owczarzaki ATCC 30864]